MPKPETTAPVTTIAPTAKAAEPQPELNVKDFFAALKQVAEQNLLTIADIKDIIEQAVFKSFHSKFDPDADLTLVIDEEHEIFELTNRSKMVVADADFNPEYRAIEVPLSAARKINPDATEGTTITEVVDFPSYSKTIAQQIRQMITQAIRESRKEAVWEKHQSLKGQMIEATITSLTPTYAILVLDDGTTAFMPGKMRNTKIPLKLKDRIKVYVEDVLKESKDAQILVSNGSPTVIRNLLTFEVPEIADGNVEIVNVSRAAGDRSKVAVRAKHPHVDPIGAVIGVQGTRINAIINKLNGERLDVILWSPDVNTFIASALAPARVIAVIDKLDAQGQPLPNYKIAITPNRHHTLAIGRGGTNVRLAVELVNARIDVVSLDEAVRDGLKFTWNGNITPEEVKMLEAGEKLTRNVRSNNNAAGPRSNYQQRTTRGVSSSLFDDVINSFNEEIEYETPPAIQQNDTEMFSEEDLRKMEANFAFDDELAKFESDESQNNSGDDD